MRISLQQPLNVGVIKGIVRLAKNDYLKEFESICKMVVLLLVVAFTEYFILKAPKWHCNGKKNESSLK